MFNLHKRVDELEYNTTKKWHTEYLEARITKLERLIAESGLVAEYDVEKTNSTLYNLNGTYYTIKKGK